MFYLNLSITYVGLNSHSKDFLMMIQNIKTKMGQYFSSQVFTIVTRGKLNYFFFRSKSPVFVFSNFLELFMHGSSNMVTADPEKIVSSSIQITSNINQNNLTREINTYFVKRSYYNLVVLFLKNNTQFFSSVYFFLIYVICKEQTNGNTIAIVFKEYKKKLPGHCATA